MLLIIKPSVPGPNISGVERKPATIEELNQLHELVSIIDRQVNNLYEKIYAPQTSGECGMEPEEIVITLSEVVSKEIRRLKDVARLLEKINETLEYELNGVVLSK